MKTPAIIQSVLKEIRSVRVKKRPRRGPRLKLNPEAPGKRFEGALEVIKIYNVTIGRRPDRGTA